MIISKLKTIVIMLGITALSSGLFYFKGLSTGKELQRSQNLNAINQALIEQQKIFEQERKDDSEKLDLAADRIKELEVKIGKVQTKIIKQVVEVPVYRECKHTSDGVQLINEALNPNYNKNRIQD